MIKISYIKKEGFFKIGNECLVQSIFINPSSKNK